MMTHSDSNRWVLCMNPTSYWVTEAYVGQFKFNDPLTHDFVCSVHWAIVNQIA